MIYVADTCDDGAENQPQPEEDPEPKGGSKGKEHFKTDKAPTAFLTIRVMWSEPYPFSTFSVLWRI